MIPYGYCHCGCGGKTKVSKRTRSGIGHKKGEPINYIRGHSIKGKIFSPLADRFWSKVDKRSDEECWNWFGCISGTEKLRKRYGGRGSIRVGDRMVVAPRVAWELTNGVIPDGLAALHKCDNPLCCNPSHLFLGTQLDNIKDRESKGRGKGARAKA